MRKSSINNFFKKFGFEVHGTGYIQAMQKKEFKNDAYQVQKEICKNARTVFDLGANRGDTVDKYKNLFAGADIYAFEPYPASFNILNAKHGSDPHIKCLPLAVSDSDGESTLHINSNVDTNSILPSAKAGLSSDAQVNNVSKITVKAITIDSFCKTNKLDKLDILKMDIQGGELAALKGAEGLLRSKSIKLIYLETYFVTQYMDQPLFYDIAQYLKTMGYMLQDFYNPIYGKGKIAWCDVIFLP